MSRTKAPEIGAENQREINAFLGRLGVRFKDPALLRLALTHTSRAIEDGLPRTYSNERLEFLGDAFFDAVIGEELYRRLPDSDEGELTKLRSLVVCEEGLCQIAGELTLGEALLLGRGQEMDGGRRRTSILADAMEAVIGAMYLDQVYEKTKQVVLRLFGGRLRDAISGGLVADHKSALQEYCQSRGALPHYKLVDSRGPAHETTFTVSVSFKGKVLGEGRGHSKKEAEQQAAKAALARVREG